ncbi:hypothetical protein EXIGLDRAFT_724310 [Exidia glandulosa HHB12029]|uniref:Uncharacterized protein n=1 Tax=Exidia glandulosa HHB12029 TaxID=1314781 RepID=A0A166BBW6_EXIGL|nr:hypothetical protein EXIGLDRAFT_724310 [Exidia glandulosa HHB12029]
MTPDSRYATLLPLGTIRRRSVGRHVDGCSDAGLAHGNPSVLVANTTSGQDIEHMHVP